MLDMVLACRKWDSSSLSWNTWLQTGAVFLPEKQADTFLHTEEVLGQEEKKKKSFYPTGKQSTNATVLTHSMIYTWKPRFKYFEIGHLLKKI